MRDDVAYYMQYVEELGDGYDFTLNDWEADFVESLLKNPPKFLTEPRKNVIKKMTAKYLHTEIK